MLDVKLEPLGKEKTLLDQIFGDILGIIDMYDCRPANERQWEEVQNYKGLFTKEWAEETRKFTQFRNYLTQMGDKLLGSQEVGPDRRGGRDRYVPQARWRPGSDYRGDHQSRVKNMAREF